MFTQLRITDLSREVAHGIAVDGHYYFQSKRLMDAFGLADSLTEKAKAIDLILTFNKQLNGPQCDLMRVGFVRLDEPPPGAKEQVGVWHGFTYTVQSRRHQNEPLLVTESFRMDFPLLALANMTASMWIQAYQNRPQEEIFKVSQGK